ncbi:PLP-dependent aspartate aminotransferase family protein [Rothia sp. ZJ1223]|uniref:trans-sulfuration enzyme family protein n=1 Tax=Rothia sp. ZJ1223 TaxID=2811098 RepID=UPI00195CE3C1|nr:PLP-dependent transferase [Rothia sp. ZJ1223]MBM7052241.1 PLP-dependent transferase [Rothia sp. ZJ1223]
MTEHDAHFSPLTRVVAGGRPPHEQNAPVNPPIEMTSTYYQVGPSDINTYARFTNQSWEGLEEVVADLEGASLPGLVFASGMAAIAAIQDLVPAGSTLLIPAHAYMASVTLAKTLEARGIARVIRFDIEDTDATVATLEEVAASYNLSPETVNYAAPQVLLWIESPTNPMMEVADLPVLLAAARRLGVVSAVDNTFATPLGQNPLAMGADVVVHSATKAISGHSDVLLGISVTSNEQLRAAMYAHRTTNGAIAGPFEAWLGLRGIRTLGLRVKQSSETALYLAKRLQEHSRVVAVRYPGLTTDPGYERASAQMKNFGSILAVTLDATAEQTDEVSRTMKLWTHATSLGGVESLVERRRRHRAEPVSIPESMLRLSVGIEDAEDLYQDFVQALSALEK